MSNRVIAAKSAAAKAARAFMRLLGGESPTSLHSFQGFRPSSRATEELLRRAASVVQRCGHGLLEKPATSVLAELVDHPGAGFNWEDEEDNLAIREPGRRSPALDHDVLNRR